MSNIKMVYLGVDSSKLPLLEDELIKNVRSSYKVGNGTFLVHYSGTAKELSNFLRSLIGNETFLVLDINTTNESYWGYMNKELWKWIEQNKTNTVSQNIELNSNQH